MFDIIVVVKNGEHCISETLRSISSQFGSLCEIYFIDGDSSDKTVKLAKDFHLKFFLQESDSGIYDAMNKGINVIPNNNKRYTLFLNCGDFFLIEATTGSQLSKIPILGEQIKQISELKLFDIFSKIKH